MDSRTHILQNIRKALTHKSQLPTAPAELDCALRDKLSQQTPTSIDDLVDLFRRELEIVSGEFTKVKSDREAAARIEEILRENGETRIVVAGLFLDDKVCVHLAESISIIKPEQLATEEKVSICADITTGIVDVAYAVADSATLAVPFGTINSTLPHFLPDCVIALVRKNQLIADHFELFDKLDAESAKNMLLVTGPSRTADIEKILILGAHGPRRLIVILIDD